MNTSCDILDFTIRLVLLILICQTNHPYLRFRFNYLDVWR
nr:MAG TPA: hypothetical protein [Caudoviricetes sp.]